MGDGERPAKVEGDGSDVRAESAQVLQDLALRRRSGTQLYQRGGTKRPFLLSLVILASISDNGSVVSDLLNLGILFSRALFGIN